MKFPQGFLTSGVAAGIKSNGAKDLAIVLNVGRKKVGAAVFTKNRMTAAPVIWSKQVVKDGRIDAIIINSGGANACTGPEGFADTHQTADAAFLQANTPSYVANSAAIYANGAFAAANNAANTANTDYTTISIAAGSYGNSNYTPIVNVAANGRVTGISTVATAGSGGSANNWYSANGYFINSNTITSNITVTSGNNALSIGPITVNNNVTTLVQSASRWIIL